MPPTPNRIKNRMAGIRSYQKDRKLKSNGKENAIKANKGRTAGYNPNRKVVNSSVLGELFTTTLGNNDVTAASTAAAAAENNLCRGESSIDNQQAAAMDSMNVVNPVEQLPGVICHILPETTKKTPVILRFVILVVDPCLV